MDPVRTATVTDEPAGSDRLAKTIADHTETMNAVERLCAHAGETLVTLAKIDGNGFYPFTRKMMVWADDGKSHPTTSAQCVSAIQDLLRVIGGPRTLRPEPVNLPHQPLARTTVDKEWLRELRDKLNDILDEQMKALANSDHVKIRTEPTDSTWLGTLNPFTSAHIFSSLAQSEHLTSEACWKSLFGILWALHRKYPHYEVASGVVMPHSLPTAFITSHCIDSIETLIEALGRRHGRLQHLISLISNLENHEKLEWEKEYVNDWYVHRNKSIHQQINTVTDEIARDATLTDLFRSWNSRIIKSEDKFTVGSLTCDFVKSFEESAEMIKNRILDPTSRSLQYIEATVSTITKVRIRISHQGGKRRKPKFNNLPDGLLEPRYRKATEQYFSDYDSPETIEEELPKYWTDHEQAARRAQDVCNKLHEFVTKLMNSYGAVTPSKNNLATQLRAAVEGLEAQRRTLSEQVEGAISWSESVMDHQLALFRSSRIGEFDVAELAHAARTVSRTGVSRHAAGVLDSIDAICRAQHPDGNWPATQPFFWNHGGVAAFPHSAEVAWALVSILRAVVQAPERFGMSQSESLSRLDGANQTLRRFLRWLTSSAHDYQLPVFLKGKTAGSGGRQQVFGWCSDRTPEPDLVHTWATANVIEFLVEFRALLQDQINIRLRIEFLSYHPADLRRLDDFHAPDLGKKEYEERIGTWLRRELQLHIERAKRETNWISGADYKVKPKIFSLILAGPPGSAKSTLAKCIAGQLGWPLIAFSPADFLAAGEGEVEARSRHIFDSLQAGSRVVYFFDEIDELIVDRAYTQNEHGRSVFSFLTPSFLTKLQDLRDAAEVKGFLFLIGTNYLDRIDQAAKRPGRIDRQELILYPDSESRRSRIIETLRREFSTDDFSKVSTCLLGRGNDGTILDAMVEATFLLPTLSIDLVCNEVSHKCISGTNDEGILEIITGVLKNNGKFVKRNVNLDAYRGRPGAVREWFGMMDLQPKSKDAATRTVELQEYVNSLRAHWDMHAGSVKEAINGKVGETAWLTKTVYESLRWPTVAGEAGKAGGSSAPAPAG